MTAIWFVALLVFLIIESQSLSVVSIWFAAGALAAMIASICGGELWLQGVLFAAVSAVTLACLRPVVRKFFTPKLIKTNLDALIGEGCLVTEEIDNIQSAGRVKLNGMEWSARSTAGEIIPQDTLVQIDRIEGVKVYVSKK